jgi:hypothetical protein
MDIYHEYNDSGTLFINEIDSNNPNITILKNLDVSGNTVYANAVATDYFNALSDRGYITMLTDLDMSQNTIRCNRFRTDIISPGTGNNVTIEGHVQIPDELSVGTLSGVTDEIQVTSDLDLQNHSITNVDTISGTINGISFRLNINGEVQLEGPLTTAAGTLEVATGLDASGYDITGDTLTGLTSIRTDQISGLTPDATIQIQNTIDATGHDITCDNLTGINSIRTNELAGLSPTDTIQIQNTIDATGHDITCDNLTALSSIRTNELAGLSPMDLIQIQNTIDMTGHNLTGLNQITGANGTITVQSDIDASGQTIKCNILQYNFLDPSLAFTAFTSNTLTDITVKPPLTLPGDLSIDSISNYINESTQVAKLEEVDNGSYMVTASVALDFPTTYIINGTGVSGGYWLTLDSTESLLPTGMTFIQPGTTTPVTFNISNDGQTISFGSPLTGDYDGPVTFLYARGTITNNYYDGFVTLYGGDVARWSKYVGYSTGSISTVTLTGVINITDETNNFISLNVLTRNLSRGKFGTITASKVNSITSQTFPNNGFIINASNPPTLIN